MHFSRMSSRIQVHDNGTLIVNSVSDKDAGDYLCVARSKIGDDLQLMKVSVSMKPAKIEPKPNTGSHHQEHSDGTLTIFNPRKEDAGKYRCGAKNSLGYIEKLIILEIGQKPYILTRPRGIIRSVSGEPLYLHCLSDGSPRPRIYWTIPGGHTLTRPQVLGRYHLLENGTLVVHDTTLHDRGNYVCRARNEAGEAGLTVPVLIIGYPPRITTGPPPSLRAVTGTPIRLSCVATGIPKPQITWELPNDSLLHPQGTLIIQKPTASDSGTYKCLAKNHLGKKKQEKMICPNVNINIGIVPVPTVCKVQVFIYFMKNVGMKKLKLCKPCSLSCLYFHVCFDNRFKMRHVTWVGIFTTLLELLLDLVGY
uniref:Ig-like domain-containing protein n=1 Tax=Salarias fasciatus TaxID=181472 RepID=A0A672FZ01_SALFA